MYTHFQLKISRDNITETIMPTGVLVNSRVSGHLKKIVADETFIV